MQRNMRQIIESIVTSVSMETMLKNRLQRQRQAQWALCSRNMDNMDLA
jgi:hypothetical protein